MGDIDRDEAERELTRLLKRALKVVPYLRLDRSDEVTHKFKVACDLLEANLVPDYSPSELDAAEKSESEDAVLSRQGNSGKKRGSGDDDEEDDNEEKKEPAPPKIGLAEARRVTTDYSSPSLGRRSLKPGSDGSDKSDSGMPAVKASSRAVNPSSRAQAAAGNSGGSAKLGFKGSGRAAAADDASSSSSSRKGATISAGQITKPLTQDFASPRLGGRALGAKGKEKLLGGEYKDPEDENVEEGEEDDRPPPAPAHGKGGFKTNPDPLAKLAASTHDIPSLLEAPHSPLQLNASRRLLELSGNSKSEVVSSPKPGFLRRLDSPSTHSGILLAKRKQLSKMIRRARAAVPYVNLEAYQQIKQALTDAVLALEASTTKDSEPELR